MHKNGFLSELSCSLSQEKISEDDHHSVCQKGRLSSENEEMIIWLSAASQDTSPAHTEPAWDGYRAGRTGVFALVGSSRDMKMIAAGEKED